jgi:dihydroorotate dehydrogenase electron transfer subunit
MKDAAYTVAYNSLLEGDYYKIGLQTGWTGFVPGQFGMVEVPPTEGLLLRRPFSFAQQVSSVTEILYKVVGKGTEALKKIQVGASLKLLGPLGHGFTFPESEGEFVGVAGGYGIAPFLEMAKQLKAKGQELTLFYGARSKQDLLYIQEFTQLKVKLHLSTVDGSVGHRGFITELLTKNYPNHFPKIVWSCGPMGLLKAVKEWSHERNVPSEVSIEETMGCGTGVCLGCVVQNKQGHYIRVCVEGPVFASEEIKL